MGWKIIFAPQALEQLEQIVRFIAQHDPTAAERFGNYLVIAPNYSQTFRSWEHRIGNERMFVGSCANRITSTIVFSERNRQSKLWTTGTPLVVNHCYEKELAEQWREKAAGLCCPRGTRIQSGGAQAARRESKARIVASRLAEWGTTRLVERH